MTTGKTPYKRGPRNSGVTLVEVVVTMFISGIAISGLVMAYADNLTQWNGATEKMVLHNEGTLALEHIARFVHMSHDISVSNYGGFTNAKLDTRFPQRPGNYIVERSAEFFFASHDKTLRWNSRIERQTAFNLLLCPLIDQRARPGEHDYIEVDRVEFTPIDPTRPNNHPQGSVYMLKAELDISSPKGESLTVTRYMAKFNKEL